MSSRHTKASGLLTRSLGITDNLDLVVGIHQEGHIIIREEPTDRKLRRGEKLQELKIDVRQAWEGRDDIAPSRKEDVVREVLEALFHVLPTAPSENTDSYKLKCWMWDRLKLLLTDDQVYTKTLSKIQIKINNENKDDI